MYSQTTPTDRLPLEEEDHTQLLTLEQRLRYFDGHNLPLEPARAVEPSRLQRLLQHFRR